MFNCIQSNLGWRFPKILWPPQNIWTLNECLKCSGSTLENGTQLTNSISYIGNICSALTRSQKFSKPENQARASNSWLLGHVTSRKEKEKEEELLVKTISVMYHIQYWSQSFCKKSPKITQPRQISILKLVKVE